MSPMSGLHAVINEAGQEWKDDVLAITGERFERRLAEEMGALRVDVATQLSDMRVELLKWCFVVWVGQLAAVSGIMAFLLKTVPSS